MHVLHDAWGVKNFCSYFSLMASYQVLLSDRAFIHYSQVKRMLIQANLYDPNETFLSHDGTFDGINKNY